ncbi:DNA polymerase/3'-5' exonuclease PolX [Patescibacteria group bacterium]|nr:DNA polymerase/3'-5' exonuclease PolX [Patescibacteria group bacterium]MCL5114889.1 DNA polymerase/3'-5' exonuclease PolX [Patescibacteria group bacterium]
MASNKSIAEILYDIAEYLNMDNIPFKPRAYEKAAEVIEGLEEDVSEIYKKGGLKALENIPGIGISIAEKIEEFIKTGKVKYYEELKKKMPIDMDSLRKVEGLGPQSIKKLYEKLGIKTVEDLKKAAEGQKIRALEGFGEKSEEKILKSLTFLEKSSGRFILGFIMPEIEEITEDIRKQKGVEKAIIAGSVRRMKETIGDADILVVAKNAEPVMDYFVRMPEVVKVTAHGETKSAIKLKSGLNVDLRIVPRKSYGAALNYFTGSKAHNIALREIAVKHGMKLNEYGLFKMKDKKETFVAGRTEEELYKALGLHYIEPEMREDTGEIELSRENKLPKLIGYRDLKGDLQVQTNWTDGSDSIETMAREAIKQGLEYIVITDHTKRLAMTGGLDEKRMKKQMEEVDKVNKKLKLEGKRMTVLKGSECDILKDGTLDLPDSILSQLDVVGASVHSYFNLSREEQTERIKRAMDNKNVDVIFHPTGRVIQRREAYDVDMDELIRHAKRTGTILEIDALPERADLKDEYIRKCVAAGVKMSIDSDAHMPAHFQALRYGIAEARRGFAEKKDIINAWPLAKMKKLLKDRH